MLQVIGMMSSMGLGMILLVSTDRKLTPIYPLFAVISMAIVANYLYFLVITCMTFVMYRDKKRCST
ncbi:unnamed protein product, partial [Gongylonema pulchrum]|uniref:SSD domain-containing protein n=1 Tax=Gongylonema pulchrum TaxID=637853 RepID=A0A183DGK5_9BILA